MRSLLLAMGVLVSIASFSQPAKGTRTFSYLRFYNGDTSTVFDSSFSEKYELKTHRVFVIPEHYQAFSNDSLVADSTRYRYFIHAADSAFGINFYPGEPSRTRREHIDSVTKFLPSRTALDTLFADKYELMRSEFNKDSGTLHQAYLITHQDQQHSTCFLDYGTQPASAITSKNLLKEWERNAGLRISGYRLFSRLDCAPTNVEIRHSESPITEVPATIIALVEQYRQYLSAR